MKLECTIDSKSLTLHVNSTKPLSLMLIEDVGVKSMLSHCQGNACGNCIVLVNDVAVLSCIVPAFRLKDAKIRTFETFHRTRLCRDIERAYRTSGNKPCPDCYASKTLLIESILIELMSSTRSREEGMVDEKAIMQELSLNT
ncbi:MAG TPA: ferredoxin, partial [Sphaerochaeta sp.]|nr:ferredoxin [Sphaerochaeta sp.]